MGMKVDLEFSAKWELPRIPMYCIIGEHHITEWDGAYYDHTATKACVHGMDVRTTAMNDLVRVIKEQNSPPWVRKNREVRCFMFWENFTV